MIEREHDRIRIERIAAMELHILAQLERIRLLVIGHVPRLGQHRLDFFRGRDIRAIYVLTPYVTS